MEKEIFKKVERFVELSNKFSKSEKDIFGEAENKLTVINGLQLMTYDCDRQPTETVSRAQKIRNEAEIKAQMAEDFDEYIKLREQLNKYFKIINN